MEYELRDHGLVTILLLEGDLTFQEIEELGSILHHVVHDTSGEIVVDLSRVGYADNTVAGQFVAAKREATVKRRSFVLSNPSPTVRKVLKSAHAGNLVQLYDTTEEAIADLAEKARGGEPRRIVPDIKCGHDDCVYYTYAKVHGVITPSCEYAYPDEISNNPSCRCYRVNWKHFQQQDSKGDIPFPRDTRKKSLYRARDSYFQESVESLRDEQPEDSSWEDEEKPQSDLYEEAYSSPSAELDFEDLPQATGGDDSVHDKRSSNSMDFEVTEPDLAPRVAPDPFADDNFPSATEGSGGSVPQSAVGSSPDPPPHPVPQDPPDTLGSAIPLPKPEPKSLVPDEVVRRFVESWNENRFDLEYDCMATKNQVFSKEEYFARRRTLKNSQTEKHRRPTHQKLALVDSTSIQGDHATVEITRLDRTPQGVKCYAQHFTLIKEEDGWKIHHVETGGEKKNPTIPPKDRKMKADDFLGKSSHIKTKRIPNL